MLGNVEAVRPEPTNVSELRSYLGMLNYYQNYLPALATMSEPLHILLWKGGTILLHVISTCLPTKGLSLSFLTTGVPVRSKMTKPYAGG